MHNSDIYIFEDFEYDDEYLINLSGIRALHPRNNDSDSFTYVVYHVSENDHSFPTIMIYSEYFLIYVVKINIKTRIIENKLIISTGLKKGVHVDCLKEQVEFAIENNFHQITILALKRAPIEWGTLQIPVTGYMVFGKYGYMMYVEDEIDQFIKLMKKGKSGARYIYEIYDFSVDNGRSKALWDNGGDSWFGVFRLSKQTKCYEILHPNQANLNAMDSNLSTS